MGAAPHLFKGLGFRFIQPKKGVIDPPTTVPVGRDGIFQAYCPPYYKNMDEAIEAFHHHKQEAWKPEKPFPYAEPDRHLMRAPKPTERTIQIVKDVANYIYDTYGRFPAFVDPMYMRLVFQAMNIDVEFYDKYYPKGRAGIGDPVQEAAGMLAYIKDRYGSPEVAWGNHSANPRRHQGVPTIYRAEGY